MKANEMPKRIYLFDYNDTMVTPLEGDTVYVREDAFIENALKWYCLDCICNDTCSNTCYFKSTFKKYLKGNDKQLPPKIENAINPDGSTTENYRYRHFISRMQDAFFEKARKWFEMQNEGVDSGGNYVCDMTDFEDFVKYMKGE